MDSLAYSRLIRPHWFMRVASHLVAKCDRVKCTNLSRVLTRPLDMQYLLSLYQPFTYGQRFSPHIGMNIREVGTFSAGGVFVLIRVLIRLLAI